MYAGNCQRLFERGLSVIPLMPKEKRPAVSKWSDYSKRLPSQEEINKWSGLKNTNIGLVCGQASNIVAIDIDKDTVLQLCPLSPLVKKGMKGETRFFKYNNELNIKRHDIGIEILSDGSQTVLPPSIHPDTELAYVWVRGHLENFDLETLPTIPQEFLAWLGAQKVTPLIGGRNTELVRIAGAMVERGEDITAVTKELLKFDLENHTPPWFSDPVENHKKPPEFIALAMATRIFETANKKDGSTSALGFPTQINSLPLPPKPKTEVVYPEPKSKVLESLTQHILDNSEKPRYPFALIAALTTCGIVLANKLSFLNEAPTLFSMLICDSGGGKDTPMKAPEIILDNLGLGQYVGMNDYRSDAAAIASLGKQPIRIDRIDEASKLYKSLKGGNQHTSKVAELLSTLYTSTNGLFRGHKIKDGDYGYCFNPCISIIGGTTSGTFTKTFSEDFLEQGFGARFIYFYDDTKVAQRVSFIKQGLPKDMACDWLKFWGKTIKVETQDQEVGGLWRFDEKLKSIVAVYSLPRPVVVDILPTPSAEEELEKCSSKIDALEQHYPEKMRPSLTRAIQQIKKIALIHAATRQGVGTPSFKVDGIDVIFARELVMACLESTTQFFTGALVDEGYRKHIQLLCLAIKKYGPITLSDLTRKTQKYTTADRNKILRELEAAGEIFEQVAHGAKKPVKTYWWNYDYKGEKE